MKIKLKLKNYYKENRMILFNQISHHHKLKLENNKKFQKILK